MILLVATATGVYAAPASERADARPTPRGPALVLRPPRRLAVRVTRRRPSGRR